MRWIGTLAAAMVVALGLVGAVPSPACACSCVPMSVREHFERADVVFAGTLVSREESGDKATLVFEVSSVYKGEVAPRQEIVTNTSGASCGLELTGRGPHLVFGGSGSDFEPTPDEGQYVGSLCDGSKPFDAAARAELAGLEPQVEATRPVAAATPTDGTLMGWWIGGGAAALLAIAAAGGALVWRRRRSAHQTEG